MKAIARILCPTDFSETARRALGHAAALAARHGAEVLGLHAYRTPAYADLPYGAVPPPPEPDRAPRLTAAVRDFLAPAEAAGVRCRAEVVEGGAAAAILARARDEDVDLVAMGTHGRSGLARFALGSVTEAVLHQASCPVLSVAPPDAGRTVTAYRRVLCPLDLGPGSEETVRQAAALAGDGEARLVLLHVLEGRPDLEALRRPTTAQGAALAVQAERTWSGLEAAARERLRALAVAWGGAFGSVETLVAASGHPWREVVQLAQRVGPDLVVMGSRAEGLEALVFGSTANQVVRHAPCPVITVRRREGPVERPAPALSPRHLPNHS